MKTSALNVLALATGAAATACLTTCGGCYSMSTHVITCYSDLAANCPYDNTSYYGMYSSFYAYPAGDCPDGIYKCGGGGTNNYKYGKTCTEGDLVDENCCAFEYATMAGYQPVSQVVDHGNIDGDLAAMKSDMSTDYNFSLAYKDYSLGGQSCKSWTDSSSGWPYGSCSTRRTVMGFGVKDLTGEAMFDTYAGYWGSLTYADDFVSAALLGTTDPGSGVNFGSLTDVERYQLTMKGAAYQSVWIYALHEYESALVKCAANSLDDASGAPHAWDEGWAFYAGSDQSVGGTDGQLVYTLAEKRCGNFATCGTTNDATTGTAYANIKHLEHATAGLASIRAGDCTAAADDVVEIKKWMTVPLIQGTIRYAYKCDPLGGNEGAEACSEGYAFAAALLPQLDAADAAVATLVKTNMIPGASIPDGYLAVQSAIQSTYHTMGLLCSDIGGLVDSDGAYMAGMSPCADTTPSPTPSEISGGSRAGPALALLAAAGAVASVMV